MAAALAACVYRRKKSCVAGALLLSLVLLLFAYKYPASGRAPSTPASLVAQPQLQLHRLSSTTKETVKESTTEAPAVYVPPQRLVHLDLKGAPPKVSYLKRLFPLLKTLGATGLLLEYEDTFPFEGALAEARADNAYTKDQIEQLLRAAKDSGLETVPLVQTFGHLEFVLKREAFAVLREVPESPQALCPSSDESLKLVRDILNQVMRMHPDSKYLHIGCDEVFQMGACRRCRKVARDALFLSHVNAVADYVAGEWPAVTPIIWDDMLRHVPEQELKASGIGAKVQPMVWVYAEDVYRFVPRHVWDKYASVFPAAWSASAFKGAFGENEYVPDAKRHLDNNLRWLEVMSNEGPKFRRSFAGAALTGWQRYDHFSVLCELLPAAVPSLAVSLSAASRGGFDAAGSELASAALGCPQAKSWSPDADPRMWERFGRCVFPGNSFFKLTARLHAAEAEVKAFLEDARLKRGWMTAYNVRHNYSAPLRVAELTADLPRLLRGLSSLARAASDSLGDVCDPPSIAEWIEQRIYPDIAELERLQADAKALLKRTTWEKRPVLSNSPDLKRFGLR